MEENSHPTFDFGPADASAETRMPELDNFYLLQILKDKGEALVVEETTKDGPIYVIKVTPPNIARRALARVTGTAPQNQKVYLDRLPRRS